MSRTLMTCEQCDDLLAAFLEDELEHADRSSFDAHTGSCARCQGLLREIAEVRETAASLPDLSPSRDLWEGIEARIQPEVVPIGTRREAGGFSRRFLAMAAAGLVIVSSSVTYMATTRVVKPAQSSGNAVATESPVRVAGVVTTAEGDAAPAPAEVAASEPAELLSPTGAAPSVRNVSRTPIPAPAELAVAGEIRRLQLLLSQRREQLEPATVKTIEDNLAIIDAALSQARSALARDPASGFLNERLENTLQKKVDLLRTVALLPSST